MGNRVPLMSELERFKATPDVVLTPDQVAETIPELAEYAHITYDEPLVMMPSVIDSYWGRT